MEIVVLLQKQEACEYLLQLVMPKKFQGVLQSRGPDSAKLKYFAQEALKSSGNIALFVEGYAGPAVLKCCSDIGLEVSLLIGHSHGSLVVNGLASLFKRLGKECPVILLDPRTTENQLWSLPMSKAYTSVQNVSYPLFRLSGGQAFSAPFVPHPLFREAERLYQEDTRIAPKGAVWSDALIAHIKDANHVAVSKFYDISTQIQQTQRQNDAERVAPAP
eukprot:s1380_g1.t1